MILDLGCFPWCFCVVYDLRPPLRLPTNCNYCTPFMWFRDLLRSFRVVFFQLTGVLRDGYCDFRSISTGFGMSLTGRYGRLRFVCFYNSFRIISNNSYCLAPKMSFHSSPFTPGCWKLACIDQKGDTQPEAIHYIIISNSVAKVSLLCIYWLAGLMPVTVIFIRQGLVSTLNDIHVNWKARWASAGDAWVRGDPRRNRSPTFAETCISYSPLLSVYPAPWALEDGGCGYCGNRRLVA